MMHAGGARKQIGRRTIFNLLGPLASPARVRRQLVGVFSSDWLLPYAEALKALGSDHAWIVHGRDGLDEISISGPTDVAILDKGAIARREIVRRMRGCGAGRWRRSVAAMPRTMPPRCALCWKAMRRAHTTTSCC